MNFLFCCSFSVAFAVLFDVCFAVVSVAANIAVVDAALGIFLLFIFVYDNVAAGKYSMPTFSLLLRLLSFIAVMASALVKVLVNLLKI